MIRLDQDKQDFSKSRYKSTAVCSSVKTMKQNEILKTSQRQSQGLRLVFLLFASHLNSFLSRF